jgi:hypothetical protein
MKTREELNTEISIAILEELTNISEKVTRQPEPKPLTRFEARSKAVQTLLSGNESQPIREMREQLTDAFRRVKQSG